MEGHSIENISISKIDAIQSFIRPTHASSGSLYIEMLKSIMITSEISHERQEIRTSKNLSMKPFLTYSSGCSSCLKYL